MTVAGDEVGRLSAPGAFRCDDLDEGHDATDRSTDALDLMQRLRDVIEYAQVLYRCCPVG